MTYLFLVVGLLAAAAAVLAGLWPRVRLRRDPGGQTEHGLAIFIGGVRWFGARWGLRSLPAGLRRAGFQGQVLYRTWHHALHGWLVLPALLGRRRLQREAHALAEFITFNRRQRPDRPVYLLGCSAGGYLAVRTLELLPDDVRVDGAALLSAAFDPRRDLRPALAHVRGRMVITSSILDCFVLGVGTILFGGADGRHVAGIGMVGPRPPDSSPPDGQVVAVPWRPWMVRAGRLGGHASATPPAFIAECVAPPLLRPP